MDINQLQKNYVYNFNFPCYSGENPVEDLLRSIGGRDVSKRVFHGIDHDSTSPQKSSSQFEFWFTEYEFGEGIVKRASHSARAFLTGQMYPRDSTGSRAPVARISVRIGNLDCEDPFTEKLVDGLQSLLPS